MTTNNKRTYKIAVDAMGGDFAPANEVQGAVIAYQNKRPDMDFEIVFVGNEKKIKDALQQTNKGDFNYSIVPADEVVTMDDDPTIAIKKKKNSSLSKGLELHSQGLVDGFVSAGNTGAVLSTATIMLGRIKGASRPTMGSFFPSKSNTPTFVLDVGANIECKPKFLYEFAVMGSIFVTQLLGIQNPRVGLLNIGEESKKGTEVVQETYKLLENSKLNFVGNIEGRDVLPGCVDVVVCDGFVGNILLKYTEGTLTLIKSKIKQLSKQNLLGSLLIAMASPALKMMFKDFDYQKYGGVPILGINGLAMVGHGKSSPAAIQTMIYKAYDFIRLDVNRKIEEALKFSIISEQI